MKVLQEPTFGRISYSDDFRVDACVFLEAPRTGFRYFASTSQAPTHHEVAGDDTPKWAKTLKDDILKGFDYVIDNKLKPIKSDISDMKIEINNAKNVAEQSKSAATDAQQDMQKLRVDIEKRIGDIEKVIKPDEGSNATSVVVGGLGESFEDANRWMFDQVKKFELPAPLDTYHKGEDFKGLLFCKFPTAQAAKTTIEVFNGKAIKFKEYPVWCKHDLPLEPRTCRSFLLGLRRQLILWGSTTKKSLKVPGDSSVLEWDDTPVVSASVHENKLQLTWLGQAWKEWQEFQSSPELQTLVETANQKLSQAAEKKSKGTGKGKSHDDGS